MRLQAFALSLLLVAGCAANVESDDGMGTAEDALGFDQNSVLPDSEFTDASSLSASEIQSFLEHTHCGKRSSLADYSEGGKSAAQMIADASSKYDINPIEFLTRLQVERGLLCKPASDYMIKEALSCGCPDTAACASMYAGFGKQISCAGSHLRGYLDDIASKGHTVSGWAPHKTKYSSDPLPVTPSNAATAALYTYTPWVYNGGNQLHYQVWNAISKALGKPKAGTHPETKPAPASAPTCGKGAGVPRGCTTDANCNHGVAHSGWVCASAGPERGTCIDGCHSDADCADGQSCDTSVTPHAQCTGAAAKTGTACSSDDECTGGSSGASRVCSADSHQCIFGCHSDSDCGSASSGQHAVCDRSLKTWQCVYRKEIGDSCGNDNECNGGFGGTQRVCNPETHLCDDACKSDFDCDAVSKCVKESGPVGMCHYDPTRENSTTCRSDDGCPALVFPSGVKIQTKRDAALEASYAGHLKAGETAPKCFIDIDDLKNPDTGEKLEYSHVRLSDHFTLHELVDTEISQGYGHRVLVDPDAVQALEDFRRKVDVPFSPNSGFRSPRHQEAICASVCKPSAKSCSLCSAFSRHMHGDAFDLPVEFYSYKYAKVACDAGFLFAYDEAHSHLHVDMNPIYKTCAIKFD